MSRKRRPSKITGIAIGAVVVAALAFGGRSGKDTKTPQAPTIAPTAAIVATVKPTPRPTPTPYIEPTERPETRVYIARTGRKYHRANCRTLSDSDDVTELTISEAESGGYEACKVCNPY